MDIKSRKVTVVVVDEINLTADQWDPITRGTVVWRDHQAKLLNARAKKLAPQCDPVDFYCQLARFCQESGFGRFETVVAVTERIYGMKLEFKQDQAA